MCLNVPKCAQDMHEICPRYAQDMPEICQRNMQKNWGKMSRGKMSTIFTEAKCPGAKMSVGQNVLGAKCPLAFSKNTPKSA